GLDGEGRLAWTVDLAPGDLLVPVALRGSPVGSVAEIAPAGMAVAAEIGARLARHPGAALLVDYGHAGPAVGDTLQAVRRHAFAPVLEDPGEADLTAHVDFTALADAAGTAGAAAYGPVGQGALLLALGIRQRADALKRSVAGAGADVIEAAFRRLVGDDQMGRLFKALALASPGAPVPAGFEGQVP
ncbi:MAG TPA: SAM-dependent methyltransferase, partial [Azospirillaceae bacterium]|nr:SAM-dependent methyltransferase [Azospirillaceae bacterium]